MTPRSGPPRPRHARAGGRRAGKGRAGEPAPGPHLHRGRAGARSSCPARPEPSSGTGRRPRLGHPRLRRLIALVIVLTGGVLAGYPFVSSWMNQRAQDEVAHAQQRVVASASPARLEEARSAATSYNARLLDGSVHVVDPFDATDARPGGEEYERVLNLAGDGVMGELIIPTIGVDLPIYHYTDENSLSRGVGHVVNTSVPIGGASTHAVLAGHTGLPTATMLDRLDELASGDWFIIRVLGEDHAYRVYSTEVVLPEKVESLSVERDRDLVTLVTCTPYGVNTHRLLVHAERTDLPAQWTSSDAAVRSVVPSAAVQPRIWRAALAGAAAAAGIILTAYAILRLASSRGAGRTGGRPDRPG